MRNPANTAIALRGSHYQVTRQDSYERETVPINIALNVFPGQIKRQCLGMNGIKP